MGMNLVETLVDTHDSNKLWVLYHVEARCIPRTRFKYENKDQKIKVVGIEQEKIVVYTHEQLYFNYRLF